VAFAYPTQRVVFDAGLPGASTSSPSIETPSTAVASWNTGS
jgi:hypothetical protein